MKTMHEQNNINCFRFARSAEAVSPMGLRLEYTGFETCVMCPLSVSEFRVAREAAAQTSRLAGGN